MREVLRTADPVRLSYLQALLAGAGVACEVLDANMGALTIGAIPSRLMVADDDLAQARRILREAGETAE